TPSWWVEESRSDSLDDTFCISDVIFVADQTSSRWYAVKGDKRESRLSRRHSIGAQHCEVHITLP
ncbi:hypothetical protein AVEN_122340-1, partial [Araneus ventricosus]